MKPTVGRIVLYRPAGRPDAALQAAVVTAVADDSDRVSLASARSRQRVCAVHGGRAVR
ncbi:hypothetical protein CL76_gp02 [Mycobacterium phage Larva]|uniref:Uncharacterized protein n=1 Tax=Mycobacterium phage Larva TaxID=2922990 RepID=G1FMQ5_9CAUD|nr:hypothetical protein CL76_gp02 [Mycobacterium phage Larva]AEL19750.1 hypothetical protein LARVA_2 [Mycobacterium phage Larva]